MEERAPRRQLYVYHLSMSRSFDEASFGSAFKPCAICQLVSHDHSQIGKKISYQPILLRREMTKGFEGSEINERAEPTLRESPLGGKRGGIHETLDSLESGHFRRKSDKVGASACKERKGARVSSHRQNGDPSETVGKRSRAHRKEGGQICAFTQRGGNRLIQTSLKIRKRS